MEPAFIYLYGLRIPGQPNTPIFIDGSLLRIVDYDTFNSNSNTDAEDTSGFTAAVGIATVLYTWCPDALFALLDEENWLSCTWILSLPDETKIEIGRIRNQITFGTLDSKGCWTLMVTYDTSPRENGARPARGTWIPNPKESMLDGEDVTNPNEIDRLGRSFARDLIIQRHWLTQRGMKHEFFIESVHIGGMDPWEDGIAMDPHWLYHASDLGKCTACELDGRSLNRCGRCGTAAYCSDVCQRRDWPVHKAVCSMSMEDRGKALHLTKDGGLVSWARRGEVELGRKRET